MVYACLSKCLNFRKRSGSIFKSVVAKAVQLGLRLRKRVARQCGALLKFDGQKCGLPRLPKLLSRKGLTTLVFLETPSSSHNICYI